MKDIDYLTKVYETEVLSKCTTVSKRQARVLADELRRVLEDNTLEDSGRTYIDQKGKERRRLQVPINPALFVLPNIGPRISRFFESRGINNYQQLVEAVKKDSDHIFNRAIGFGRKAYYAVIGDLSERGIRLPEHRGPLK
jgi:Holliday junction resolvasome RuvABC DNA-binding subunit